MLIDSEFLTSSGFRIPKLSEYGQYGYQNVGYFKPNSSNAADFDENEGTIKKVFWIGYASYAFDFVFIFRELIVSLVPGNSGEKAYLIYYITLNAIVISSAFLYLPIVISIRKFTHLASAKLNNPQRFVLWQLIVVAAEKTIWLLFYFGYTHYVHNNWPILDKIYVCKVIDSAFMMVVVKLTYLGCNRRNSQTILAAFGPKNILKKLKFWDHRSGQVHPQVPAVVAQIYTTNA